MAIELVVLDMAGTTVEDKDNVHIALIDAFKKYEFSILREDANKVMGLPKPAAIQQLLKNDFGIKGGRVTELTEKIHRAFVTEMISFYKTDTSVKAKRNAEETFSLLKDKGIKVAIDTGFSRDIADTIIKRLGWKENKLIDFSVTSDEVKQGRPHPDMIFEAMKLSGVKSAKSVAKVGDTVSDLMEGNSSGCKYVIGITTGAYTRNELAKEKHTHLISDLKEVIDIVTEG
ncbi:MAG TPA: HAD hydrolase-like protein [Chitinophagales bacterium]|nr:HAD hydrolase-like protein [Chitinophagales bacterium]